MDFNKNLKYLGCILGLIIIIFIIVKLFNPNLVEGMSGIGVNANHVGEGIKNNVSNLTDNLHIDKYRKDYEDIIINLEEWCKVEIIKATVSNTIDVSKGLSEANMKQINNINQMNLFRDGLNKTMGNLDSL